MMGFLGRLRGFFGWVLKVRYLEPTYLGNQISRRWFHGDLKQCLKRSNLWGVNNFASTRWAPRNYKFGYNTYIHGLLVGG